MDKTPPQEKKENKSEEELIYETVLKEIQEVLNKHDYELLAMPIITPDGRILARPVLGPKEKKAGIITSEGVV